MVAEAYEPQAGDIFMVRMPSPRADENPTPMYLVLDSQHDSVRVMNLNTLHVDSWAGKFNLVWHERTLINRPNAE